MATTWADIQRLASDLQQAQLAERLNRLSEGNCIEVVANLIASKTLNLVVSTDAKEYVTFDHLQTEIRNECAAAGNRVVLTELAARLRVEFGHVESAVAGIVRDGGGYILCAGELVHRSYIEDLCTKINAKLREVGQVSLLQLTKNWDIPAEFLATFILPEIGRRIHAVKFEEQFYTVEFIAGLKRQLIAILCASTKVLPLSTIHAHLNVSQSLFFTVWSELTEDGHIPSVGQLCGAKSSLKSVFVPKVLAELAKRYVKRTLIDNGFIDCGILKKLSIADQAALFKELFPRLEDFNGLLFLPSVVINADLWAEIGNNFGECMKSKHYCVVEDCIPDSLSFVDQFDLRKIGALLLKQSATPKWKATDDCAVVFEEETILGALLKSVEPFIAEKAKSEAPKILAALRSANLHSGKSKEAGKKATATADEDDWGTGGKNSKKKGGKKGGASSKSSNKVSHNEQGGDSVSISLNSDELLAELSNAQMADDELTLPDVLMDELREEVESRANALYRAAVERCFNAAESAAADDKRRAHDTALNHARSLYTSIFAFESGANALGDSLSAELKNYLLKTLGMELANMLLAAFSSSNFTEMNSNMTVKARNDRISSIAEPKCREYVQNLYESLQSSSINEFHEAIAALRDFSFMLKQPDKASRLVFVEGYCVNLRQKIVGSSLFSEAGNSSAVVEEAPLILLSFVLFLLGHFHKVAVHASGKFVSQLTAFLVDHNSSGHDGEAHESTATTIIPADVLDRVLDTQKQVVALIRRRPTSSESADSNNSEGTKISEKIHHNLANLKEFLVERSGLSA